MLSALLVVVLLVSLMVVVALPVVVHCQWGPLLALRPVAGRYGVRSALEVTAPARTMDSVGDHLLA